MTEKRRGKPPLGSRFAFFRQSNYRGLSAQGLLGARMRRLRQGVRLQRPQARGLSGINRGALRLVVRAGRGRSRRLWRAQVIDLSV